MLRHGRLGALSLLAAAAALALAAPASAEARSGKGKVRAATLNLYLGSDLVDAVLAPNVAALEAAAGRVYESIVASNPRARMRIQARLIKRHRPDVLGLQEVETIFRGPRGDPAPATEAVFDFRRLLLRALRKRGLPYRPVARIANVDVEAPTDRGIDVRLVDHDVLLVRRGRGIKAGGADGGHFDATLQAPLAGGALGTLTVPRGWVEANVRVRGTKLHVVNTHLESFLAPVRNAQAEQLAGRGGPLDSRRPVVLLGDLNSDPDGTSSGDSSEAYRLMIADGFADRGVSRNTCCWSDDLLGGALTTRLDHVLVRPPGKGLGARRTGAANSPLTAAGQFPSDHTGVFSRLRFR